jgi:hypothetical protein
MSKESKSTTLTKTGDVKPPLTKTELKEAMARRIVQQARAEEERLKEKSRAVDEKFKKLLDETKEKLMSGKHRLAHLRVNGKSWERTDSAGRRVEFHDPDWACSEPRLSLVSSFALPKDLSVLYSKRKEARKRLYDHQRSMPSFQRAKKEAHGLLNGRPENRVKRLMLEPKFLEKLDETIAACREIEVTEATEKPAEKIA